MPWRMVDLRGTRVFARVSASGSLLEEDGKVEIRYKQNDGKAYRALVRNLTKPGEQVFPDEHCGDASAAPKKTEAASDSKPTARKKVAAAAISSAPTVVTGDHIVAYTDGACSGNPGPAGLGVVLLLGSDRKELSEYLGTGTNNIAELTAILRAIEAVDGAQPILVHTDSQYAIGVLTKGWKAKANQELIASIKARMQIVKQMKLVYVPGHAGVPLNERADELARAAVSARATSGWQPVRELRG